MALFKKRMFRRTDEPDESLGLLDDKSPWPVQEAYRALRTNISFSLPGDGCKVIGVTSAIQHDGKSINCANTAISFADIGESTLLVECDLRLPTIGAKMGIPTKPGLSDCLAGHNDLASVLRRNVRPNLDVIPAGNIPPDPTWILQSEQMKDLITFMRDHYSYIFIDLSPVTTVTDASLMAPNIDGYVIVVRDQITPYPAITETLAQLRLADGKIIGFLYNDVKQESRGYYSHYYKKGYYKSYYQKGNNKR